MSEDIRDTWGTRIAEARREASLTQRQLADRVGVAQQTVQAWEQSLRYPADKHKPVVAAALGVPVHDLFPFAYSPGTKAGAA